MRSLSIQVQPERSPGLDMEQLCKAFEEIAGRSDLVAHHSFDNGEDGTTYFNFTFGTTRAKLLWQTIRSHIYKSPEFGPHMSLASMAMCSSETGWHAYLQLFHFDPSVRLDPDDGL